jgi:hypothetical protein
MSALDDQAKKVRSAINEYDMDRAILNAAIQLEGPPDMIYLLRDGVAESTTRVLGETEALLTILDQHREPI